MLYMKFLDCFGCGDQGSYKLNNDPDCAGEGTSTGNGIYGAGDPTSSERYTKSSNENVGNIRGYIAEPNSRKYQVSK